MIFFHTLKHKRPNVLSRYWIWFPLSVLSACGFLWFEVGVGHRMVMAQGQVAQGPGGEPNAGQAIAVGPDASEGAAVVSEGAAVVSEGVAIAGQSGTAATSGGPSMFHINVKVVNLDRTSLRNLAVYGWFEVKPKGELELPEVLLSSPSHAPEIRGGFGTLPDAAAIHGGAYMGQATNANSGGAVFGVAEGAIGSVIMSEPTAVGGGFGGPFPSYPGGSADSVLGLDHLDAAVRSEVEQRITWQVQADWVRDAIRSAAKSDEENQTNGREQLKELLRTVLRDQYADQLRRQKLEFEVVERRVEKLRKQIADRSVAAERAIEFELERVELVNDGLMLEEEANFPGE